MLDNKKEILKKIYNKTALLEEGLILTTRNDGFGSVMIAMVNAIYISQITNMHFGLVWNSRDGYLDAEELLFEQDFLDRYSYTNLLSSSLDDMHLYSFSYLKKNSNQLYYFNTCNKLTKKDISDLDENEYGNSFSKIYYDIPFNIKYKKIFGDIDEVCKTIGDFTAFHLRANDVVYSERLRKLYTLSNVKISRFSPIEIVFYQICRTLCYSNVVLFTDDDEASKCLKKIINYYNFKFNFYVVTDFHKSTYGRMEKVFFDVNLMAKSKLLFGPDRSAYSELASLIGKIQLKSFLEDMTFEERIDRIIKYGELIKVNDLWKANSYLCLYLYAKKKGMHERILFKYLHLALKYDYNNGYKVLILGKLIKLRRYFFAEKLANSMLRENYKEFFNILFVKEFGSFLHMEDYIDMQNIFLDGLCQYKWSFPYLNIIFINIVYYTSTKEELLKILRKILYPDCNIYYQILMEIILTIDANTLNQNNVNF
ncbi:TPA: hypothetical protein SD903_001793, partial [Campylobacter jejuni]|nr:hypothetical protein [Campylobacter jejuni]